MSALPDFPCMRSPPARPDSALYTLFLRKSTRVFFWRRGDDDVSTFATVSTVRAAPRHAALTQKRDRPVALAGSEDDSISSINRMVCAESARIRISLSGQDGYELTVVAWKVTTPSALAKSV